MRSHVHGPLAFAVCVITCGSSASATAGARPPTVTLTTGTVAGTHFGPAPNDVAFLGVPYAAPPVGGRRWKPPQPVPRWRGTRPATRFGPACPQLPASWLPYIGWSEDCLYLNVWTPRPSPAAKLPVIVYLHGGSNAAGYGQMTPLGPALSSQGIVVVSANYRLGPMGFLAHPALTAESPHHSSGNYGLLDQVQALEWVRDNISRVGGDPGRVTVMGQSAGAVDTCLLMASPLARGLFQEAIMESGDCEGVLNEDIRTRVPYASISGTGEAAGERLARDLGVPVGPDALPRLRDVPAREILEAWKHDPGLHFDAIVDGWVVAEQPARTFAEGRQMRIPVLVGSNADEATVFAHAGPRTVSEYRQYLLEDTGRYSTDELRAYPVRSDADVPARYLQLQNDSFAYGAYSLAQATTRVGEKAYLYSFTYAEAGPRARLGAYHGEELEFLGDSFRRGWIHTTDDEKLGTIMRAYWSRFARTGNPDGPGLPKWPAYDARRDECLELGRTIRIRPVEPRVLALERIMRQVLTERVIQQGRPGGSGPRPPAGVGGSWP